MKNSSGVCDKYPDCGRDVCYDPDVICPKLTQKQVTDSPCREKDNLSKLLEMQLSLNERISDEFKSVDSWDERDKKRWLLKFCRAIMHELGELEDSIGWKWWLKQKMDVGNVKIELIDILHFLLSAFIVIGMDADEIMELYEKKNRLNFERQEKGYKDGKYDKYKDGIEDNRRLLDE